jgi:hypothetical protein
MGHKNADFPPIPLDGLELDFSTFMELNGFACAMEIQLNDAINIALNDWLKDLSPNHLRTLH